MLSTVPATPPVAGPERALDALLSGAVCAEMASGRPTVATRVMVEMQIAIDFVICRRNTGYSFRNPLILAIVDSQIGSTFYHPL